MSTLIYTDANTGDSIELAHCLTLGIEHEPVYAEPDFTEYMYSRVNIHVRGLVSSTTNDIGNVQPPTQLDETTTDTYNRIRRILNTPRNQLQYYFDETLGIPTYFSPTLGNLVDSKDGPYPKRVRIMRVVGTASLMVEFEVETFVSECSTDGTQDEPDYISHRWRESVSIDENFYSTKTRQGKIVTRADIGVNPDALRGIIVPDVGVGFKRVSSDYTLQEDGLALSYTYVDREYYLVPPSPATKASGTYTETSPMHGAIRFAECRIHLEGPKAPNRDKGTLLATAINIAVTRIAGPGGKLWIPGDGDPGANPMFEFAQLQESMWENIIDVTIRARINATRLQIGDPNNIAAFPADLRRFGADIPGTDPTQFQASDPGTRGTATQLALVASQLHDPCLTASIAAAGATSQNATDNTVQQFAPGGNPVLTAEFGGIGNDPAVTVNNVPVLPDNTAALYDVAQNNGFWDVYKLWLRYENPQFIFQMPVAQSAPAQPSVPNNVPGILPVNSVFVQVAAPLLRLHVDWSAEKRGAKPEAPNLISDPNAIMLSQVLEPGAVDLQADGTVLKYIMRGKRVYGFIDPTQVRIQFGLAPWIVDGAITNDQLTFDSGVNSDEDFGAIQP